MTALSLSNETLPMEPKLESKLEPKPRGKLTKAEQRALDELEKIVDDGLADMKSVGKALFQIHEQKLYRVVAPTFEEYVHRRFGISKSTAYRLMEVKALEFKGKREPKVFEAASARKDLQSACKKIQKILDAIANHYGNWDRSPKHLRLMQNSLDSIYDLGVKLFQETSEGEQVETLEKP